MPIAHQQFLTSTPSTQALLDCYQSLETAFLTSAYIFPSNLVFDAQRRSGNVRATFENVHGRHRDGW